MAINRFSSQCRPTFSHPHGTLSLMMSCSNIGVSGHLVFNKAVHVRISRRNLERIWCFTFTYLEIVVPVESSGLSWQDFRGVNCASATDFVCAPEAPI